MVGKIVQNDVFKFVALRPPAKPKIEILKQNRISDPRPQNETPVGKILQELGENAGIEQVLPRIKQFIAENKWSPEIQSYQEATPIAAVAQVLDEHLHDPSSQNLDILVKAALGTSPKEFFQTGQGKKVGEGLWDRLQAFYLLNRETPVNYEELIAGLRALNVVKMLAEGTKSYPGAGPQPGVDIPTFHPSPPSPPTPPSPPAPAAEDLKVAFNATVLLSENLVRIAPRKPAESPRTQEQQKRDEIERNRLVGLWSKYMDLNKAAEELQDLQPEIDIKQNEPAADGEDISVKSPVLKTEDEQQVPRIPLTVVHQRLPKVSQESLSSLGTAARSALAQTGGSGPGGFAKIGALSKIHRELAFVTDQLFSITDPRIAEVMPAEAMHLPAAMTIKAKNQYVSNLGFNELPTSFPYPWLIRPKVRPLGIGDLKVVKQTLERYVAGEVAHIENVLKGESKERKHRRFDRTEETITIALETTEETERDTQTTDRFELKKEAEKTIQTDMSIDAGITVSASYGPVELGAYANFAYSQSTTDTTKTSSNFARDVVDRSVSRIQKKTREERITKTIQEVEEINTHGLNNVGGPGHITGVYRWVDKHYKSQVYNYGKRMMFEFILPEPAAFFIYSQNNNPAKAINVEKPNALGNITHKDITEWNYQNYIRDYNVQGITPPPPFSHILSIPFDQSGMQEKQSISKSSRDLVVSDGYVAKSWWGKWSFNHWDPSNFDLIVGAAGDNLSDEDMVVPIAIEAYNVAAYAVVIEVYCERTARHYEDWQIKTFEKIMAAYQSAMAQYEDKLRAAEARQGVIITGQNPAINREIERTEMKKHCITMLTGERFQNFNAMSGSPPEIDLLDAADEGRFIQFFEQAFEWEQMTYLFYPYFWGRKSNWVTISTTFDNDPMLTRFLQAGAARVVLPVHPAYNDAILYYLQTGDLWNGGDPPVINDPLYIALYEELKDQQDDLGNAVAEGDPWKVVLPTTLVWLQPGPELPDFTQP